jgi:hypothetical protein
MNSHLLARPELSNAANGLCRISPFRSSPMRLHAPFRPRPPPSTTASFDARKYTAATLRLSLRAITVVFVCSRASVFSTRSSSFVHGRLRVIFFAIIVPMHQCHRRINGHRNAKAHSIFVFVVERPPLGPGCRRAARASVAAFMTPARSTLPSPAATFTSRETEPTNRMRSGCLAAAPGFRVP